MPSLSLRSAEVPVQHFTSPHPTYNLTKVCSAPWSFPNLCHRGCIVLHFSLHLFPLDLEDSRFLNKNFYNQVQKWSNKQESDYKKYTERKAEVANGRKSWRKDEKSYYWLIIDSMQKKITGRGTTRSKQLIKGKSSKGGKGMIQKQKEKENKRGGQEAWGAVRLISIPSLLFLSSSPWNGSLKSLD